MKQILSYSEMMSLPTYGDRLAYLNQIAGLPHQSPRDINQKLYKSKIWKQVRDEIIARDFGCDLADRTFKISGVPLVHHINPLVPDDIIYWDEKKLFDPENLITTSYDTHNKIHYKAKAVEPLVERRPGDTIPWLDKGLTVWQPD